jgi:endo-1,4-beta-D-glucanase Y
VLAARMNQLDSFFSNSFNEDIHAKKHSFITTFLNLSKALAEDYLSMEDQKKGEKEFLEILFTVLRYYQFIQEKSTVTNG